MRFLSLAFCSVYFIAVLFYEVNSIMHHHKPIAILRDQKTLVKRHLSERAAAGNLPPCKDDDFVVFLAQMKAINPESILNLATEEDIPTTCRDLSDNLDRVDSFLGTCKVTQQGLYVQLIKGVDMLFDYICNSTNTKDFIKYFNCFHALHNDYVSCTGPADWTEFKEPHKVCNAYQAIVDCYYVKTAKVCGLKPAKIMKRMNTAVINKIVTVKCKNVRRNPRVPDAFPRSAGICRVPSSILILFLFSINSIMIIHYIMYQQ